MSPAGPDDFALARATLLEITTASTIGEPAGSIDEGNGTVTVYFESTKAGYPGWRWTVSIARIDGGEPTVLETELTPGEGALLSPDWVPWSDRLADYEAAQEAERAAADGADTAGDSAGDEESDDDDDYYDDDPDDDDEALLHGGDLDGVDIDEIANDDDDDSDDDEADDDEADDDDSDDDDSDDDEE